MNLNTEGQNVERICSRCERSMLTYSRYRPRIPGARYHASKGLCTSCGYTVRRQQRPQVRAARPLIWSGVDRDPDPIAIERALAGDRVRLNPRELDEVIGRLDRQKRTALQIAELLGCTTRTVQRHRARNRAHTEQAAA